VIAACVFLVPSAVRGQEQRDKACESQAFVLTQAILQTSHGVRLRLWTDDAHYQGTWLGWTCKGLAVPTGTQTLILQIRDIRRLQVGRHHRAGWKGALIGAALGAGLGAALKVGDTRGRGAAIGAIAWGIDGALAVIGSWRDVPLPSQSEESDALKPSVYFGKCVAQRADAGGEARP
jgi:hypothetical protein